MDEHKKTTKDYEKRIQELERAVEMRAVLNTLLSRSLQHVQSLEAYLIYALSTLSKVEFIQSAMGLAVFLRNEQGEFELKAYSNLAQQIQEKCAQILSGHCPCGSPLQTQQAQYVNCTNQQVTTSSHNGLRYAHYNTPILFENSSLGALMVYLPHKHTKSKAEMEFLKNYVAVLANTINNFEKEAKIKKQNETLLRVQKELKTNIEELKTTHEDLSLKQKKLKNTLAENLSINNALNQSAIISITDLKGNIIHVNEIFCEVSGYTKDELIGKNQNIVNAGYHPKDFWKKMWQTISTGHSWRGEIKNKTKQGEYYWVDSVINPMFNEEYRIYRYLSIRYLVTDKKNAEIQIRKINKDLTASIRYAQRIQDAIIFSSAKINTEFPNSFVFAKPKDIVSGDFFYYTQTPNADIVAAVDCTGHGVPGALMSLVAKHILDFVIKNKAIVNPADILDELRKMMVDILRQKETQNRDGVDIALCAIDRVQPGESTYSDKRKLTYAGTNPLVLFQDEEMTHLKGNKIVIGGWFGENLLNKKFQLHTIPLNKPTTFYAFSDGIQDQFGGEYDRRFSSKRLRTLLQTVYKENMATQQEIIEQTISSWQGTHNSEQVDDMLLIGVKI